MKSVYYITLIFSMMFYPLFPAEVAPGEGLAVLKEGTVEVKGLPGFGPNRIPALFGRYESAEGHSVAVWAVNESLFFDAAKWVSEKKGAYQVQSAVTGDKNRVWVVRRDVPMRSELAAMSKWFFALEFAGDAPDSFCTAFLDAFVARTEFFFSSARRFSDLSFPAALSTAGK